MENTTLTLEKNTIKKGAWSKEEDDKLRAYIQRYGHWNWTLLPKFAGLSRSGKSCRLRWMNYLRPNIKHGNFTKEDDEIIMRLHKQLGNKWTAIAAQLPGRSDNEIKNRWNSHLKKRVEDDQTHEVLENINHDETMKPNEAPPGASSTCSSSNYHIPSDVTLQTYDYELSGDFWSDPFLLDIMSPVDQNTTPSDLYHNFGFHSSWDDMTMSEDLSWSALGSYSEYNNY
ncbi:transcription repressor MYB4 [Lactuca sativa]|uniref:Uncharacterized protein n=1 Tax=Lactuca sativa TaxID=4236 RepID=A0A9R1XMQ9_LACSA|nr:transcription repressor MYB4 [Lactuca sativa]KAJ0220630.1 hypothetical protein LSAT_V11C200066170 [Lactuca sativa]